MSRYIRSNSRYILFMIYKKSDFTPFHYFSSPKEVSEALNEKYPTKLKFNEDLVSRVALRYPLIKKSEVVLIISKAIEAIREFLIMGDTINLPKAFSNFKLLLFQRPYKNDFPTALKIKISATQKLKNGKY